MNDLNVISSLWSKNLYTINPTPTNFSFVVNNKEMLKISEEGFWVRGVKIEQDENESARVFQAFKRMIIDHGLTFKY